MFANAIYPRYRRPLLFVLLLLLTPSCLFAKEELSELLLRLDSTISKSDSYVLKREARIRALKEKRKKVPQNSASEYQLNELLFAEYRPYVCDSAIYLQNRNIDIAIALHDLTKEAKSRIELAYLMASIGLYRESTDLLQGIDRRRLPDALLFDYYHTYVRLYGELTYYTQDKRNANSYWWRLKAYTDSLKRLMKPTTLAFLQMKEDSLRDAHSFEKALQLNDAWLKTTQVGTASYALVTFHRSLIYEWKGDKENQKYYLALSAISDIQSAIKDQASLSKLASLLYEEGSIERAYNYIRYSWGATTYFNAKLRAIQSSSILSLIDKTYHARLQKQKRELQYSLLLISSLFLLLIFALVVIYKQIKKLSLAKQHLQEANLHLNDLNSELNKLNTELIDVNHVLKNTNSALSESNKIKEVYIGRFIELCSIYINKTDDFRKKINSKIKSGNLKEATQMTQSQEVMDEEFEELYVNFDNAFLQLFPDFVEKVNELMTDKIILKKGELLNPELRIIALMRLGISDGGKISQFLRYSLTTVYNYRTKTKNRTYLPKEELDQRILQID